MNYEKIFDLVTKVDDFVWGPAMLVLLVGTGIFLTIRVGFLTWRNLGYAIKSTLSKEARTQKRGDGDVSPFSALTTALAATIGTGNIVGVATAMVSGGPGALVWMWISACFGLTSKFSECMLAIKYRERNEKGEMSGGPMYTMKKALSKGFGAVLGWLFALFAVLASFGIGNMTQANSISSALNETIGFSKVAIGIVLTVLSLAVIVGGIKSISKVSSVVVPLMAVFYIIAGIIVIIGNIQNVPAGLVMIFKYAFAPQAIIGGGFGYAIKTAISQGAKRGLFSNEAGMGSTPHAHALANVKCPHDQGVVAMIGVFIDTFVVLTLNALVIISTLYTEGGPLHECGAAAASTTLGKANLAQTAFGVVFGETAGNMFVAVCLFFFAFSTILGWNLFGKINVAYLFGKKSVIVYTILALIFIFLGTMMANDLVWELSDMFNNLMVIPNVIALFALTNLVVKHADDPNRIPGKK